MQRTDKSVDAWCASAAEGPSPKVTSIISEKR